MKMITVSGAHSGTGKTLIAEALLKKLKGWSAMKVTVSHGEGSCPAHKDCNTCDELHSDFSIISSKSVIEAQGKDTQRLKSAGAKKVVWLRARPDALKKAVKKAVPLFKKTKGLIIESNSALKYLRPDLSIFVKRKDSVLKPSAREILNKMDLIVTL